MFRTKSYLFTESFLMSWRHERVRSFQETRPLPPEEPQSAIQPPANLSRSLPIQILQQTEKKQVLVGDTSFFRYFSILAKYTGDW